MVDMELSSSQNSHIIDVFMPTYIMSPTDDEKFRRKLVCKLIGDSLKSELEEKVYVEENVKAWCNKVADTVKSRIHKECHIPRYKFVVQCFIGQQKLQDVRVTSRCLCDTEFDNHASATFNSLLCHCSNIYGRPVLCLVSMQVEKVTYFTIVC
ncbi:unnamed protein product [Albugo candida]|uniref:Uncharacterized protein n=3 Tax=Albugo candida TaxID=65357 RepID=A0A024G1J7_9STRA|nr:unnamed protein product [Albugo candida]|eukprot:CCI40649.1 unnamed protein product [Albugo candida]